MTGGSEDKPTTTTAVMAIKQQLQQQQAIDTPAAASAAVGDRSVGSPRQEQQQQQSLGSVSRLLVVLGLWTGVLWWAGRWLLLQAPAAAGSAAASTCQHGMFAAEEAAVHAVECIVRAMYGLVWAVAKQLHTVMARAAQVVLVQGAAAAQQACCIVLWVIGFANADSQQQRSQLQQLLVQVLQLAGTAAGRCGQWGMASAEVVAAAVTVKLLRDASPVTQVSSQWCIVLWNSLS